MTKVVKSKPGKTGTARSKKVTNKSEAQVFAEVLATDNGASGIRLDTHDENIEDNDLYIVHTHGASEQVISSSNERERLRALWLHERTLDKKLWRRIRFNVMVQNPVSEEISFESILEKIKTEKNNGVFFDHGTLQKLDQSLWKIGAEVTVPPGIAQHYTSIKYDMGYEGLGNVTTVRGVVPIERKYLHVADYVDHLGG